MEYAAATFWMLIIVLSAMAVHRLWSSMVQPRVVNSILLPGTLVAQLGHILGLLVTGGTVNNTALIKDDDSGEPQTGKDPKPRVPIVGTIVIALLPMIGCAIAIYWVSRYWGTQILTTMEKVSLDRTVLPKTLPLVFAVLRKSLDLVEHLVEVIRSCDLTDWRTALFLYLVVCLTVRMAPLTGNLRGSLGAILVSGLIAFLLAQLIHPETSPLDTAWPLISFSVAVLLLLLMVSLLIKGAVDLTKTFFAK